jgi:hypothetical protein
MADNSLGTPGACFKHIGDKQRVAACFVHGGKCFDLSHSYEKTGVSTRRGLMSL